MTKIGLFCCVILFSQNIFSQDNYSCEINILNPVISENDTLKIEAIFVNLSGKTINFRDFYTYEEIIYQDSLKCSPRIIINEGKLIFPRKNTTKIKKGEKYSFTRRIVFNGYYCGRDIFSHPPKGKYNLQIRMSLKKNADIEIKSNTADFYLE